MRQRQTTQYRLKGPAEETRELLIEHPRLAGWDLEEPDPKAATLTESHYRLSVSLKAGEEKLLPATGPGSAYWSAIPAVHGIAKQ